MAPTPPYAVLEDGRVEPLTNCPGCGELGLARFAHYHVCPPKVTADESLPKTMREILEIIAYEQRDYFCRHPEDAEAIRRTEAYRHHIGQLCDRANQLPEGHWGHGTPIVYVELMSDAYVWARLVE